MKLKSDDTPMTRSEIAQAQLEAERDAYWKRKKAGLRGGRYPRGPLPRRGAKRSPRGSGQGR
jgi:hypothetical protein